MCQINYSAASADFGLSFQPRAAIAGQAAVPMAWVGDTCTRDYIVIPGGMDEAMVRRTPDIEFKFGFNIRLISTWNLNFSGGEGRQSYFIAMKFS